MKIFKYISKFQVKKLSKARFGKNNLIEICNICRNKKSQTLKKPRTLCCIQFLHESFGSRSPSQLGHRRRNTVTLKGEIQSSWGNEEWEREIMTKTV